MAIKDLGTSEQRRQAMHDLQMPCGRILRLRSEIPQVGPNILGLLGTGIALIAKPINFLVICVALPRWEIRLL